MDDYISREDVIMLLHLSPTIESAEAEIRGYPAADVVEVVRCKDCKHRPISTIEGEDYGFFLEPPDDDWRCPCLNGEDGWYSWMPEDDFYCADGERRTEKEVQRDE